MTEELIAGLNAPAKEERLAALRKLMGLYNTGELQKPRTSDYVNNHIHTIYSFSPYSPTKAAYTAWASGLCTAGIMDHDTVSGAEEFIEAGKIIGIAATVGFECRCTVAGTAFDGMRINNPDQNSVAYLAMHGIPHQNIGRANAFLAPYREKRNIRNRAMTDRLNEILEPHGLHLDFDADIAAISRYHEGGAITERHILFAMTKKLVEKTGRGEAAVDFLEKKLGLEVTGSARDKLLDAENPMYEYYLLGVLKSGMVERFYIDATDECPHITDFVRLADELGAISAHAYLGDVAGSVTGDKKDQTFEDAYLDEWFDYISEIGFRAVTYMPTRNTSAQLERVTGLCHKHGFFQISGEDINSPFQSFICGALDKPEFKHLITSTWALIGHETAASRDISDGMFSAKTLAEYPGLNQRIERFAKLGKGI